MSNKSPSTQSTPSILFISNDSIGKTGTASKYYYPLIAHKNGYRVGVIGDWNGAPPPFPEDVATFDISTKNKKYHSSHIKQAINEFKPQIMHVFFHRGCRKYPLYAPNITTYFTLDIRGPLLNNGIKRLASKALNIFDAQYYNIITGHATSSIASVLGARFSRSSHLTRIGVDLNNFQIFPTASETANNFVYIGSVAQSRGLKKLIYAFYLASHKHPQLSLDIIGDGNARNELEDYALNLNIHNVNFLGSQTHTETCNNLNNYDAGISFIGPKVYHGAPPLKILEYFAAGLPVVASNTPGNKIFMTENKHGFFANDETPESLAIAIEKMVNTKNLSEMSQACQRTAKEHSWQKIVPEDLMKLYSSKRYLPEQMGQRYNT